MDVRLNREQLEQVNLLKYLGSVFTVDRRVETEVRCNVKEMERILGKLRKVFKHRILSMSVKRGL